MPSDNVTPFRRPPKKPVVRQQGGLGLTSHRGKVVLAHLLTIAAFLLNFFFATLPWSLISLAVAIGAVLLVYTNRGEAMPWANTHHEYALRTLIIGYAINVLASLLGMILGVLAIVGFYITVAVTIWAVVRAVIGLVLGVMRKPIPNPRGWLV